MEDVKIVEYRDFKKIRRVNNMEIDKLWLITIDHIWYWLYKNKIKIIQQAFWLSKRKNYIVSTLKNKTVFNITIKILYKKEIILHIEKKHWIDSFNWEYRNLLNISIKEESEIYKNVNNELNRIYETKIKTKKRNTNVI